MKLEKNIDAGLLIIRLSIGVLMLFHGVSKLLHGVSFIEGMLQGMGLPTFIAYGVYVGEVIAPLAIIAGFKTRLFASIYAFNCIVAVMMVHTGDLLKMTPHGGWAVELLGLYFFGALALIFTGGGKYSTQSKSILD